MAGSRKKILWYIELIPKLGISNVIYVLYYRLLLKTKILVKKFPVSKLNISGELFFKCPARSDYPPEFEHKLISRANNVVNGIMPYYSFHWQKQSTPPDWFLNPFNGKSHNGSHKHWSEIPDFSQNVGDIKNIWEASRFSWLGILARAYTLSGEEKYYDTLNYWLTDWSENNPVNRGPNWKCGQEASIRVINLLNTSFILEQTDEPSGFLKELIRLHLKRISSNFNYAWAQRNNHASSEAAALFIGGSWLADVDQKHKEKYNQYAEKGRKALEKIVRKLVYEDGSFAQHSINYHRLFLDTLSMVIFWSRKLELRLFTSEFYEIAKKSLAWLLSVSDRSGACPNLGSNDGTLLLANHSCDYLDYRPSLQLASVLFNDHLLFGTGPWDEVLFWFGIKRSDFPLSPGEKKSMIHKSGYVLMNAENSWALLRFPYFRFRPSHNDVFHFDLWAGGRNLLFDSGSFSYNPDKDSEVPDLKSVHAHNTLSFDGEEQMPRLGRFLLGKWIKPVMLGDIARLSTSSASWKGAYRTFSGNLHRREIIWDNKRWEIHDRFTGKSELVTAGFNFEDQEFSLSGEKLTLSWGEITVSGFIKLEVIPHRISRYYMHSEQVNRFVISARNNSELLTTITINQ